MAMPGAAARRAAANEDFDIFLAFKKQITDKLLSGQSAELLYTLANPERSHVGFGTLLILAPSFSRRNQTIVYAQG